MRITLELSPRSILAGHATAIVEIGLLGQLGPLEVEVGKKMLQVVGLLAEILLHTILLVMDLPIIVLQKTLDFGFIVQVIFSNDMAISVKAWRDYYAGRRLWTKGVSVWVWSTDVNIPDDLCQGVQRLSEC